MRTSQGVLGIVVWGNSLEVITDAAGVKLLYAQNNRLQTDLTNTYSTGTSGYKYIAYPSWMWNIYRTLDNRTGYDVAEDIPERSKVIVDLGQGDVEYEIFKSRWQMMDNIDIKIIKGVAP